MAIERRPFGRTGHRSSAVIFGGAALWEADRSTAERVLDLLLEHGVNHIDTAPRYGRAEELIGPWMDRHRGDFFLATKTRSRDREGAREDLARSLERLRTDRIDLIQLHALIHPDDWERAMGPGGALEALVEARAQGLVRFIGVTGHGWSVAAMHRRSLERFPFDSVLLPWNWFCASHETYGVDFRRTLAMCEAQGVAVQTIKALARGAWAAGAKKTHGTWYEPITDPDDIRLAVAWVLAQPGLFLNTVGDVSLLPLVLQAAAARPAPPSEAAMARLAERQGLASIFGV
jgi:aryl-alcohol dehydrogenase-like predicted oxidoreductase